MSSTVTIIVALISGLCVGIPTLVGNVLSNRKNQSLICYRINELEKKQDKHNSLMERMFKVEVEIEEIKEKLK